MESFTCIWTGIAYRSTIYSIYFLFLIVYHNWKHAKFSIPLKYKELHVSKHKCFPLPFFLCSWDQRLRVVGYCFSPVCPLTFLISFEGKMFEILFFGVNVDTLKGMLGMFLLGIWETAQPNMQKGYWIPTLLLKK